MLVGLGAHALCFNLLSQTSPVCSTVLTLVNLETSNVTSLRDNDLTVAGNSITFTSLQLIRNRRYNTTITASSVTGSALFHIRIGKEINVECVDLPSTD